MRRNIHPLISCTIVYLFLSHDANIEPQGAISLLPNKNDMPQGAFSMWVKGAFWVYEALA